MFRNASPTYKSSKLLMLSQLRVLEAYERGCILCPTKQWTKAVKGHCLGSCNLDLICRLLYLYIVFALDFDQVLHNITAFAPDAATAPAM
ncbi:hypothetical protein PIIN_06834 [Serendipita indica DSM 11827]|uniref:Uncharacterized protein n=1 Tax=Serendipita indica (strain DSM 11827) TaxID=1109443 RepID=G4TNJ5_SERID|nr:hypothetical protein PIIN_06834 [Serendipita indica DSM 11827]